MQLFDDIRLACLLCLTHTQAIADVAAAIKAGFYSVGLAAGVETMSSNPMAWDGGINPRIAEVPKAQVGTDVTPKGGVLPHTRPFTGMQTAQICDALCSNAWCILVLMLSLSITCVCVCMCVCVCAGLSAPHGCDQ